MLNKVKEYIAKHNLLSDGLYLVALSGGADSVCLLLMMKAFGYKTEAVHCNFKLRGEESNRDELFCEQLCKEQNIPFHRIHFNTHEYAELHKVSIEMAARELRYSYFERLRVAIGADAILVAHHRDDNIETFFLNLLRGTGIHGLEGIKPKNGYIIRPLLCLSRKEIIEYLESIHQHYITDSSNLIDDVQRNKLRLNIIPLLKTINPAALDNIQKTMVHISEAVNVYEEAIGKSKEYCTVNYIPYTINLTKLKEQASPEATFYEILKDYNVPSSLIEQIYDSIDAPVGKIWTSGEYTIVKDRDSIIIGKMPDEMPEIKIPETGLYSHKSLKLSVISSIRTLDFKPSKEPWLATLDADKIQFPLTLRQTRVGDTFHPYGMKGKKLISDYLTNCKANYFEKHSQLVVEDASGTIIWLVRQRTSQKVSLTKDTINILSLRYSIDSTSSPTKE